MLFPSAGSKLPFFIPNLPSIKPFLLPPPKLEFASGGRALPIEVKSGPTGRLRSLHLLLSEYPQCAPGVVLSEASYAELPVQDLAFVPLYYAGTLLDPAAKR